MPPDHQGKTQNRTADHDIEHTAHSIRNKLNSVTGYATLLSEESGLNPNQKEMASKIAMIAFAIANDIDQLVRIAKSR